MSHLSPEERSPSSLTAFAMHRNYISFIGNTSFIFNLGYLLFLYKKKKKYSLLVLAFESQGVQAPTPPLHPLPP